MVAMGIMLGLAGVIMLICAAVLGIKKRSFSACSESVTSEILEKHERHGKNGKNYELKVSYSVDGVEYTKYLRTVPREYNALSECDTLELLYKPRNPKNVLRPDAMDSRSINIVLFIGIGLTAVGVALFLIGKM